MVHGSTKKYSCLPNSNSMFVPSWQIVLVIRSRAMFHSPVHAPSLVNVKVVIKFQIGI